MEYCVSARRPSRWRFAGKVGLSAACGAQPSGSASRMITCCFRFCLEEAGWGPEPDRGMSTVLFCLCVGCQAHCPTVRCSVEIGQGIGSRHFEVNGQCGRPTVHFLMPTLNGISVLTRILLQGIKYRFNSYSSRTWNQGLWQVRCGRK